MHQPRAICFDVGYTLLKHSPGGDVIFTEVLSEAGYQVSSERVDAALAASRDMYTQTWREGREVEASMEQAAAFWSEYFQAALRVIDVPIERHAEIADRVCAIAWSPESWRTFSDVLPLLDELRARGIKMAVVSNFVDTLAAVCDHHELTPYFDVIVASVEAGAQKPDSRIFMRALRRLGVSPDEAWHVGDNYWADVLGARAAGLTPVLLDRAGAVPSPDCLRIERLDELLTLLDEHAAAAA
jgi:putative hydrolase of the HAD superfamily